MLTDGSSNLKLGTNGWNERLRIDSSGNVGLGGITAAPTSTVYNGASLHLHQSAGGASGGSQIKMTTSQSGSAAGDGAYLAYYGNNELYIYNRENAAITFGTNSTERLRITSDGKVGIGTASPGHKLSILGGSSSQLEIKGIEADLWLNSTGPSGGGIWRILGSTGGSTHRFRIYDNTNSREPFYIDGGTGHSTFTRASTGTVAHFITNARECNILLQNDARTWKIVNYDYTNAGADNLGFHDGTADRFIIKNNGNVQIPDGDLEVASGHGIDFSATSGTGTSELLDDYEEGTWTPVLASTGTAFTSVTNWSSSSQNRYTKIGRIVTVQCYHRTGGVDKGSAASTDGIAITGLPFTPTNNVQRTMTPIGQNVNWAGYPNHALIRENIASVELYKYASSGGNNTGTPLTVADVGTGSNANYAIFTLVYESD